ncbi:MAG TPA: SulP family inorganic anion transporter [Chloroflexota bacterium]|nr:SulP family inorganic anion transporter [Chloroflexota bacterium]
MWPGRRPGRAIPGHDGVTNSYHLCIRNAIPALRREFSGYNAQTFRADLVAGLTVAAVALPLALAFGVASGATAAAGLVTAIVAGMLLGALGGAPFQISGPTGAMSAVLIVVAARHGLAGVWIAGVMAGLLILLLGAFRMGRVVSYIPSPVITGFTSGIATIIALGQLDNVLGVHVGEHETAVEHLVAYARELPVPNWQAVATAAIVVVVMLVAPRIHRSIPGALLGVAAAGVAANALGWGVQTIGEIPRGIVLDERLTFSMFKPELFADLALPAVSIAALGAIESLLCGAVGGTMTGIKMRNNQELLAQGAVNVLVPFLGGVPATAAIARTSVGIKSGGRTRLVPIIHGLALLLAALVAAPLLARVPLAALGGVLLVTAHRMNEWETIRFFVHRRLRHAIIAMAVTMLATVVLDLTQAIVIGVAVSGLVFLRQASLIDVAREAVDVERLRDRGHSLEHAHPHVQVIYVTGPLFFGSVTAFLESLEGVSASDTLILSMRGVPSIDAMGLQAVLEVIERQRHGGGQVRLAGVQSRVAARLRQGGVMAELGDDLVHWSADQAIVAAHAAPLETSARRN